MIDVRLSDKPVYNWINLSVVIPLYNKESTVNRAVVSALDQQPPVREVILVDDGSKDAWFEALDERVRADPRLRLVRQVNQGVSVARNEGARLSVSSNIAFLDADDYWLPGFSKKAHELHERFPAASFICLGRYHIFEGEGEWRPRTGFPKGFSGKVENFFDAYRRSSFVHTSATIVRREAFFEAGGFPVGALVSQDVFLWLQLGLRGECIFDDAVLSVRTRAPDNSRGRRVGKIPYPMQYYMQHRQEMNAHPGLRRFIVAFCLRQIYAAKLGGDWRGAFRRFRYCCSSSMRILILGLAIVVTPRFILEWLKRFMRSRG